MKKLLIGLGLGIVTLIGGIASATAAPCNYQCQYDAVYGPNGSYTQQYNNIYGKGGLYCQLYGYNC